MFKEILRGFSKFFTRDKIIIFIALIILGYALYVYSGSKSLIQDNMSVGLFSNEESVPVANTSNYAQMQQPSVAIDHSVSASTTQDGGYVVQPVANPAELLPVDHNSQWAALNPSMGQGTVNMPDLLQAGYHIGLDTIGQTLRNANLQLRSDPIIPKMDIGPWNQSTIEPDLGRVPLEIGYGCK
jgi:hypothetical protein